MLKESYDQGVQAALDSVFTKEASTAFSRWFAKNSRKFSDTASDYNSHAGKGYSVRPKDIAKAEYEIAKKVSGKEGRDAFRDVKGPTRKSSRGAPLKRLSQGDALGLRPSSVKPTRMGDYASEMVNANVRNFPLPVGVKDTKMRVKGTIATRPEVRKNSARARVVGTRGVGDLTTGTAKEVAERNLARNRKASMTPAQYEKVRARGRKENLTPEQYEKTIARKRKANMTPAQYAKNLARGRMQRGYNSFNKNVGDPGFNVNKEIDEIIDRRSVYEALKKKKK